MRDPLTEGPITVARLRTARAYLRRARPALRGPYRAITRQAKKLGWPAAFRRDLTRWDRRALMARDAAAPFAWAVRECGTHLMFPDRERRYGVAAEIARTIDRTLGPTRWFWWDGHALAEITWPEAAERCEHLARPIAATEDA